ncbi:related to cytosolic sorting GGA2 TOM1 [Lecanosticta acicola]|uniref:Related to cytosolic sorting GGA2 TOM1 n=1 Tax=Lecanosticta acicola TaxID=111012 RepID=A0AAI9EAF1_9PEZI|nr:related to cytosolic sorting GGA2 TOM1 [Lecanosticta acicola]
MGRFLDKAASKCFSYPCPYDPSALQEKPPKYHASKVTSVERRTKKSALSAHPPPYSDPRSPEISTNAQENARSLHYYRSSIGCWTCRSLVFRQKLIEWVVAQRKPYTAVTVQIDRLTSEQYGEDDVGGIIDLIEVIRIQSSGPTEAARAIRKKLKYGNPHRQVRALVILDGLIQNAGSRFQRAFADEPLLERLRLMARDDVVDAHVRQKCKVLFAQWANAYKNTPGLEPIASLYKEFPKSQRPAAARQKVLQDSTVASDAEAAQSPFAEPAESRPRSTSKPHPPAQASSSRPVTLTPTSSGFSSKLFKEKKSSSSKAFKLSHEKENMTNALAQASIASTNLLNGLQLINREHERVSQNQECVRRFEACRSLRKKILYYIQHVESDEWIGSLVNANDELVKALTAYEIMDRSINDDSDSDAWENAGAARPTSPKGVSSTTQQQLAGLSLEEAPPAKPPRRNAPAAIPMPAAAPPVPTASKRLSDDDDNEEDDDPFGDSHAAKTPFDERSGMTWREV